MTRSATRIRAALGASLGLGLAAAGLAATPSAQAAPDDHTLVLHAPPTVDAYRYGGSVSYADLGLRLTAPQVDVSLWSHRASYDDPITSELHLGDQVTALPDGTLDTWQGLPGFLTIEAVSDADGSTWSSTMDLCLNGYSQRTSPDAPAYALYPDGCPYNPYTLGSVMGIQQGWSTGVNAYLEGAPLAKGTYQVTATIDPAWAEVFQISDGDGVATSTMTVHGRHEVGIDHPAARDAQASRPGRPSGVYRPSGVRPVGATGGRREAAYSPDLQSLPPWQISLSDNKRLLRFAATVWNGGNSPLVIEGFRDDTTAEEMTTYQYFFDGDLQQVGYQQVGHMHWHAGNHNHWHLDDFARYVLLDSTHTQVLRSGKRSFCLANTDAVDYTVPEADWRPYNTDLSTSCGGFEALSVREVLSSGSGDTYAQYRGGQAFRVDTLPNGVYYIAVQANPEGNLVESDTTNNDAERMIELKGKGDRRRVVVSPVGSIEEGDLFGWRSAR